MKFSGLVAEWAGRGVLVGVIGETSMYRVHCVCVDLPVVMEAGC